MKLRLLILGIFVVLVLCRHSAQAQTGANSWELIASPNLSSEHDVLTGMSSVNSTDIWAVGNFNPILRFTYHRHP